MTTTRVPAHLGDFWSAFANSIGGVDAARFYEVCIFGDSEDLANELAQLVRRGTKRATAGSVWSRAKVKEDAPPAGRSQYRHELVGQPAVHH